MIDCEHDVEVLPNDSGSWLIQINKTSVDICMRQDEAEVYVSRIKEALKRTGIDEKPCVLASSHGSGGFTIAINGLPVCHYHRSAEANDHVCMLRQAFSVTEKPRPAEDLCMNMATGQNKPMNEFGKQKNSQPSV